MNWDLIRLYAEIMWPIPLLMFFEYRGELKDKREVARALESERRSSEQGRRVR
jgi:protein involved in ribonucleotide reduction